LKNGGKLGVSGPADANVAIRIHTRLLGRGRVLLVFRPQRVEPIFQVLLGFRDLGLGGNRRSTNLRGQFVPAFRGL
jgi:hypothetical protein